MSLPKSLQLSVLDLCPITAEASSTQTLRNTLSLAQETEKLGFQRYWVAEHHGMSGIASSSPEVIIGHIAQVTHRLRVGSGGIMLPNHAPLKVAETFRTLEAFHPGRIDLGLGRAPGTNPRTALALRGREGRVSADDFPDQVADLLGFLFDEFSEDHPFRNVTAIPSDVGIPEIWILGSSDWGARFAAENGLPYAFAQHFSSLDARSMIGLYRNHFRPSRLLAKPKAMIAVHVICANSDEEAQTLALSTELAFYRFRMTGRNEPLLSPLEIKKLNISHEEWNHIQNSSMPKFVGSPKTIQTQLERVLGGIEFEELMITTMIYDHQARKNSYRLISELFKSDSAL